MARTTGPLMSIDAAGSFGQTITWEHWKGRSYARVHATPRNPRSPLQTSNRVMLAACQALWDRMADAQKATWTNYAEEKRIEPRTAYVGYNISRWTRGKGPSKIYPATDLIVPGSPDMTTPELTYKTIVWQVYAWWAGAGNECPNDIALIHRSTVDGFAPTRESLIAFAFGAGEIADETFTPVRDGPLSPGTYYARSRMYGADGGEGSISAQSTATIPVA